MLREGQTVGPVHPLFERRVAINEEGDRFSMVWGNLQSAVVLDGGSLYGDEDVLMGMAGDLLRSYNGPELSAAKALVAELEAKQLEDTNNHRLAQQSHIEAGRHFLDYLGASENLPREYRKHIVSRGIFHSSSAGDYEPLADLFTESAKLYLLDGFNYFKLAAEDRVRAALASAQADQHPLEVAKHLASVLELWGMMRMPEYANQSLPGPSAEMVEQAQDVMTGLERLAAASD